MKIFHLALLALVLSACGTTNPGDTSSPADTGTPFADVPPTNDTGSLPVDSGIAPTDTGTPVDTGIAPTDTGTPLADVPPSAIDPRGDLPPLPEAQGEFPLEIINRLCSSRLQDRRDGSIGILDCQESWQRDDGSIEIRGVGFMACGSGIATCRGSRNPLCGIRSQSDPVSGCLWVGLSPGMLEFRVRYNDPDVDPLVFALLPRR